MTAPRPITWAELVHLLATGSPHAAEIADGAYKKANEILDERVANHKEAFAEQGTSDLDSISFVTAVNFIQHTIDPTIVAALAVAGIYRLARQP